MPLGLFCEPYKGVVRTYWSNVLRFLEIHGNHSCTLFFSGCETKLGRLVLHYNYTNKRAGGVFYFCFVRASVGVKVGENKKKPVNCTSLPKK